MTTKKEATAYILDESTMDTIAAQTEIERKVLEDWLAYDQEFGLQSKVIVVMVTKESEGDK